MTNAIDKDFFDLWNGKRFNNFNAYLKRQFKNKVYRVSIDAGFTCPNRDGTLDDQACVYCGARGAASIGAEKQLTVTDQLKKGMDVMSSKNNARQFIAYFQSFSNTYGDVATLKRLYDEALAVKDVVGLSISTRPDCIADDALTLLCEYNRQTHLWIELGLQSVHDKSLKRLNRRHDFEQFLQTYQKLKDRGIRICLHIILGIPGETYSDFMETASKINLLKPQGLKIHLLHALKGSALEKMYINKQWEPMTMDAYIHCVCDMLEILDPSILIHRLTGDPLRGHLVAPLWSIKKWEILNGIDAQLKNRHSRQGRLSSMPLTKTFIEKNKERAFGHGA